MNAGARELLAWLRAASVYGDFERFFLPLLRDADAMARMKAYADKVASAAAEDARLRAARERQQDNLERETLADDRARAVLQIRKDDDAAAAIASFRRMADTLSVEGDAARLDELADALDYLVGSWRRVRELRRLALPPQHRLRDDAGRRTYESLTEKIPHGVKTGYLGAAVVAASLSTRDHTVTEDDVRGGAARPFPTIRETVVARTRGRRPRHRVAQVRNPTVLAGFSVEALQRAYDAGLPSRSMYHQVQHRLSKKQFNVAACEAVIHQSGVTNFDVSVPVPYSIFSRLPHVAPEFLPAIIQGAPVAYPLSLSNTDHAQNVTRPPIEGRHPI